MINLSKADETATIDLSKGNENLIVSATWIDNDDGLDNDDLDLRCTILMPDQKAYLVDGEYRGNLQATPFAYHHGDVQSASVDAPGEEIITVARDIAKRAGGPVALCFSVYSALDNGKVSVAELQPKMRMKCGNQDVVCQYDFKQDAKAKRSDVYTYVIGYAIVTDNEVILAPSGKTSTPGGEETPWLTWQGESLEVDIVGPAVFKGAQATKAVSYNQRRGITHSFANIPTTQVKPKKGLLASLFG